MTETYKEMVKTTFADLGNLTPEKLTTLVDETLKFFEDLQGKLASKEPSLREEALKDSMELREVLEKQMVALCEATGLDPAQLAAYAEDMSQMTAQDKAVVEGVKEKLKGLMPAGSEKTHKRKKQTLKIVG